ncbi:MAG TPA: endo alpha-1,4 polygalactosaminidase [Kofleriaceae bacterium]|nr:endo alpha-1,4 polygalactosaminidase [Kofleriaceae bacterium]
MRHLAMLVLALLGCSAVESGLDISDDARHHRRDAGVTEVDARATPDAPAAPTPDAPAGSIWQPTDAAPIHFHWMIGASSFTSGDLLAGQTGQVVYDIDGANATAADVAAIHAAGAIAVCYVDVGTLEPGRPDTSSFPASVVGPGVQGWPGEHWLLVTAANQPIILPLMKARFVDWCQAKGFDAIEPDNLDAWTNISGVSETDNVTYDLAIGQLAHALPLSIGLKNVMTDLDSSQYPSFLSEFDWALNEQCYQYGECGAYTAAGSFLPAGKAVFDVEYGTKPNCTDADAAHLNAQQTDLDLVGATDSGYVYKPCVADAQATW